MCDCMYYVISMGYKLLSAELIINRISIRKQRTEGIHMLRVWFFLTEHLHIFLHLVLFQLYSRQNLSVEVSKCLIFLKIYINFGPEHILSQNLKHLILYCYIG